MSKKKAKLTVEVNGIITDERYHEVMELIGEATEKIDELIEENARLHDELDKWHSLTANMKLPEYPVTQFHPKDLERENLKLKELIRVKSKVMGPMGAEFCSSRQCDECPVSKECEQEDRLQEELGI